MKWSFKLVVGAALLLVVFTRAFVGALLDGKTDNALELLSVVAGFGVVGGLVWLWKQFVR